MKKGIPLIDCISIIERNISFRNISGDDGNNAASASCG